MQKQEGRRHIPAGVLFFLEQYPLRRGQLTEEYCGTDCRDIARVDRSDRVAVKNYYSDPNSRHSICIKLVGDAAHALGELLVQEATKSAERGA